MATLGVFALNMSPRSGGVWSLVQGLLRHAEHSRHRFVLVSEKTATDYPSKVEHIVRPKVARLATQVVMNVPGTRHVLSHRETAIGALAMAGALSPNLFSRADAWLWPHCFRPVPNLGNTITICHDLIHQRYPEFFNRPELSRRRHGERSLRHCSAVLCPSASTAADLRRTYPDLPPPLQFTPGPVESIPDDECQAELSELNARFGIKPLFLFVGVDWPHKNHALLVDVALELSRRSRKDFHILFAGHRRNGTPKRLINERSASPFVTDLGPVSRPMLGALYRRATALLFPSLIEGFGIPLVEAMQYRLPIIASDRSCIPEVCADAAVLLPPTDATLWADAIERLLDDPLHRLGLADRSARRGLDFSWQQTWRQLDQAIDSVLDAKPLPEFSTDPARPLVAAN